MNRLSILADIAGRAMLSTTGSPRTVGGAVVVDSAQLNGVRHEMRGLPKWGSCDYDTAEHVVDILESQAVAVAIVSIDRDTDSWRLFEQDALVFHEAIIKTSKKIAGWAKPTNLLKFILLSATCAAATGHALGSDRRQRIVSKKGLQLIEVSVICDQEVEGQENLEVFTSFWNDQNIPKRRLAAAGFEMVTESVVVTTDIAEPALILADYVAGLGLAATLNDVGRLSMPLSQDLAINLLSKLKSKGKLIVQNQSFDISYDDIFKDVMFRARQIADG